MGRLNQPFFSAGQTKGCKENKEKKVTIADLSQVRDSYPYYFTYFPSMVPDEDVYPPGTKVRIKKNGQLAKIVKPVYLKDGKNFLHYLGEVEGKKGLYAIYHQDCEQI